MASSSLDGQYFLTNIKLQFENTSLLNFNLPWNLFQGLGTIYFPFRANYFPENWLAFYMGGNFPNIEVLYTGSAVLLFSSTYFFARALNLEKHTASLSGWLVILFSYPIYGASLLYPIISMTPSISSGIAASILMLTAIYNINQKKHPFIFSLIFMGSFLWLLGSQPSFVIIFSPALIICICLSIAVDPANKRFGLLASLILFILLTVFVLLGPLDFFIGYLLDSPAVVFPNGFNQGLSSSNSGIIIMQPNLINKLIGALIFISIFLCMFESNSYIKRLANSSALVFSFFLLISYLIEKSYLNLKSIHLAYFEFVMWPIYSILTIHIIYKILANINCLIIFERLEKNKKIYLFFALALIILLIKFPKKIDKINYPPLKSEIVEYFEKMKNLDQNRFYGRVLNISGKLDSKYDLIWSAQSKKLHTTLKNTGSDNKLIGFWFFGVPTLEEYSSIYSPILFYLERMVSVNQGIPMRNIFILGDRSENKNLFKLLGVSVLITDSKKDGATIKNQEEINIHYLNNEYVNGWSPIQVNISNDLPYILSQIAGGKKNLDKEVFLGEFRSKKLVKIKESKILIEEDTIRVVSSSDGQSLLVLPFLFSNCVVVDKISTDNVIIQRANGFQLSFEFYKNLDLKIKYEYGLFKNSDCRLRDFIYNNQLSENKIPSLLFKFANSYYKKN